MDGLWTMDAGDLVQGYREGLFTPMEALNSVLERSAAIEPVINAFLHLDRDQAFAAAERSGVRWREKMPLGSLDGVPVSVKDNLHVAGMPTTWGSRLLHGHVAAADEGPVARLRAAGAVLFGKTSLPEFAMQGYTSNLIKGTTVNPHDPSLTPGGSSGGAAAAVAAGIGPLALATDGGGSIRRPAAYCGLVGLKPSRGAVARSGGLPDLFLDYEVVGPLARTAADAAAMFDVLTEGRTELGAGCALRMLYIPRFGDNPVDPAISEAVAQAAGKLGDMGHSVEEAGHFDLAEGINALWPSLSSAGLSWLFSEDGHWPEIGDRRPDIALCTQNSRDVLAAASRMDMRSLYRLMRAIQEAETRLAALFSRYDVILTPATAALAWAADRPFPDAIDGQAVGPRGHAPFSAIANACGLPAICIPVDPQRGIGVQMMAKPGADPLLLALADRYQRSWPGSFGLASL